MKGAYMHTTIRVLFVCTVTALLSGVSAPKAEATLGQTASSIASDRKALAAVHRATTTRNNYTVQEFASGSGTIREYISPSGLVFAISWNSLVHPDLSTLLGTYSAEYQNALKQTVRKRGVRRQQVISNQVIVEKWGHMRDLRGRAYLPALIPSGVDINEIN